MASREERRLISKVNSTPVGLQELLGNVNQGINPAEIDPRVRAIVDLYPHWAARKIATAFDYNQIVAAPLNGVAVRVPEGELWQPIAASFTCLSTASSDDISLSIGVTDPGSGSLGGYTRMAISYDANIFGGDYANVAMVFPDRFMLPGGWYIRGQFEAMASAGPHDCWTNVTYIKLKD